MLHQPKDPLDFLIKFLENQRKIRKVIFISGVLREERDQIVESCSTYLNYKKIAVEDLFKNEKDILAVDNDKMNSAVSEALKGAEEHYRGYIVSGYPNNYNQAVFIQHSGFVAERLFIILNKPEDARAQYQTIYGSN